MTKDIEKNSEIKKIPTKFDGYYISDEKFTKSILSQYYKRDAQPNRGNSTGLRLFEY